jgi:hypothetical protein
MNNNPIIQTTNDIVKYEIFWHKNIYFTLDFFTIIKEHISNSTLYYFWTKTKHLLSQDEIYLYLNNTEFTTKTISYIISKIIFFRSEEYLENILTSKLDYLTKHNIIYHKYIHSITYFWLMFLSSSIYFFKSYEDKNYFDLDSKNIYNTWLNLYSKYTNIFNSLEHFGILSKDDDIDNINTYPEFPSKSIINLTKTNIHNYSQS